MLEWPAQDGADPLPQHHDYPILETTTRTIGSLSLVQKKKVMTALRVGVVPKYSRRQRIKEGSMTPYSDLVQLRAYRGASKRQSSMDECWTLISMMTATPVRRSILSVAVRGSRLRSGEAEQAITDGICKEISVTQRLDLFPTLQFPFFYSRDACVRIPMHPDLPFRPYVLLSLRHKFIKLQSHLSTLFLTPRVTHKTVGPLTSANYWENLYPNFQTWERPNRMITVAEIESWYAETGEETPGPCEVRYAWKLNDLKPRVYYAIGGSAYGASKLVHSIFDALCKMSKTTHPQTRYSFAGFPILRFPENCLVIYDYASFTSRLVDFKKFCAELAQFMNGVMVRTFDTNKGMEERDVGDILRIYNDVCNTRGEFEMTRILETKDGDPRVVLSHEVAGMLGVFGNIVGSTSLHGIVGLQICGGEDTGRFIGDDAGIAVEDLDQFEIHQVKEAIKTIGEIADEKFEIFDGNDEDYDLSDAWHYVKRPIVVSEGCVQQSWMPEFPMLALAKGSQPPHVTVDLQAFPIRRRIFAKQVARFLNSLHAHISEVTEQDWDLVQFILRDSYRKLQLPFFGAIPKLENRWIDGRPHGDDLVVIPPITEDVLKKGWRQVLYERASQDGGTMRIPVFEMVDPMPERLEEGLVFRQLEDRVLSLLSKIRVVHKRMLFQEVLVDEWNLDQYFAFLDGSVKPVYEYQVLRDYHPWHSYFLTLLSSVTADMYMGEANDQYLNI